MRQLKFSAHALRLKHIHDMTRVLDGDSQICSEDGITQVHHCAKQHVEHETDEVAMTLV
jgi:hypothetical protein